MQPLKAIETRYKGYRFRSRTEARWAVAFDAMGIEWEYEKEGYQLPSGWYLPDFWLPDKDAFAEVKPHALNDKESRLALELSAMSGKDVLILDGSPDYRPYREIHHHCVGGRWHIRFAYPDPVRWWFSGSQCGHECFANSIPYYSSPECKEHCPPICECGTFTLQESIAILGQSGKFCSGCMVAERNEMAYRRGAKDWLPAARSARFEHSERGW